jgi:ABC-2 type transport system permease protein
MSMRAFYMIKKEFKQVLRDKRVLFLVFITPLIQLLIFGYVASTDVKHISMAVLDTDRTLLSRELVKRFQASPNFDVNYFVSRPRDLSDLLDNGLIKAAINIAPGFEKKILRGEEAPLQAIIDASDSNSAVISSGYFSLVIEDFSREKAKERLSKAGVDVGKMGAINNEARVWFNEELKSVNFMVPGMVAMLIAMNMMMLSAVGIVKEKEFGTLEQLIVTPIRTWELLVGKMVPYILIAYIQIFLTVTFGMIWFRVPFRGNFFLLLFISAFFVIASLGQGLFLSIISKTQFQAFLSGFFVTMPNMMLSGFIFPIRNMPEVIQLATYLLPMRYFLEIVRGIFLKGIGIEYLWPQVWPLILLSIAVFAMSVSRFKKKIS